MTGKMTPARRKALADAHREAEALRGEWNAAVEQHLVRIEGQFNELLARLRANDRGRQPKGLPSAEQARVLEALLAQVRVKAKKGRAKDLRRVEDAVHEALASLPIQAD